MTSVAEEREIPRRRKSEFTIYEFLVRNENALLGGVTLIAALLLWEAVVSFGWVNPLFTSSRAASSRPATRCLPTAASIRI